MKNLIVAALIAFGTLPASALTTLNLGPNCKITLASETGLTYDNTYVVDTDTACALTRIAAQVNYTSTTYAAKTFTDGSKSTGTITIVSTTALSGVTIRIGPVTLTAGTDFTVGSTIRETAANLAAAINANSALGAVLVSSGGSAGATVYSTSAFNGANFNYPLVTSNSAKISTGTPTLISGVYPSFAVGQSSISIAAHGFTTGLPVLYTAGAQAIGGLTDQTTYFAIRVDANTIFLATTSARAQANLPLSITSLTAHLAPSLTYTLTPLALAGTPAFYWSASNDGTNYVDLTGTTISSVTISAYTYPTASYALDFGAYDYRYLRLNVKSPTAGGLAISAILNTRE